MEWAKKNVKYEWNSNTVAWIEQIPNGAKEMSNYEISSRNKCQRLLNLGTKSNCFPIWKFWHSLSNLIILRKRSRTTNERDITLIARNKKVLIGKHFKGYSILVWLHNRVGTSDTYLYPSLYTSSCCLELVRVCFTISSHSIELLCA